MDFTLPERIQKLSAEISEFVREELYPLERNLSKGVALSMLEEKRQEVKRRGWWAPHFHKEYGGMGLELEEFAAISEVLGRSPLGHYVFNCQAPDVGNMEILWKHGTPEQKERFLRPLVDGEIRSCFSMTEPENPGSNPTLLSTTAVLDGDDYVINGHKWFTSSAQGAAFAIVMAITDPTAEKHSRASQIIVPLSTPGSTLVRNISVMGEEGSGYFSHAEVVYKDCRVPRSYLLGEQGSGFKIAQERLGPGRIHHCMRWIGICERAFELMCRYSIKRQIAPGTPLGSKQIVQEWIAESRAEVNAARLLVMHAAWKMRTLGDYAARDEISVVKFYVAGVLQRVLDRAIQVHGALGMTDDTPLAYWYRHERGARIYDGPDEVHKSAVAERILRRMAKEEKC